MHFSRLTNVFEELETFELDKGIGGEVVTSPHLNQKVGCSRPTIIRARCLQVRQHYPAQKNNPKKLHVILKQGNDSGSP